MIICEDVVQLLYVTEEICTILLPLKTKEETEASEITDIIKSVSEMTAHHFSKY